MSDFKLPFEGLRIIDFSQMLAGPSVTLIASFFGAEVIRVVSHKRQWYARLPSKPEPQQASPNYPVSYDLSLNKKCITIDLTRPEGAELARRLVAVSDAVVENFRPGVMDKLGLGYAALREIKPDIVYLSVTSLGQSGPEAKMMGYGPIFSALCGLADNTGYADSPPAELHARVDLRAGYAAAFALMVALYHRLQTGEGQFIDVSSVEAIVTLLGDVVMEYLLTGHVPKRRGNDEAGIAPHNGYRCLGTDKWVSIVVPTQDEWVSFCKVIGHPELMADERFEDPYQRWLHREELDAIISEWTSQRDAIEVTKILQQAGIAAFPSHHCEDILNDAHLQSRNFTQVINSPVLGPDLVIRPPWKFSDIELQVDAIPYMGEHNDEVFEQLLGLDKKTVETLVNQGIIF